MISQYRRLIESVVNVDQEIETNEADVEALVAYVEEELAGGNPRQRFPELFQRLQTSADLQETYEAFNTIQILQQQEQIVQPITPLQLDLSFLQPTTTTSQSLPSKLWQKFGNTYELTVKVSAMLSGELVRFIDVPALLQPYHSWVPVAVSRDEGSTEFREIQEIPLEDLQLRLQIKISSTEPGTSNISVTVYSTAPDQPLKQFIEIELRSNGRTLESITLDDSREDAF